MTDQTRLAELLKIASQAVDLASKTVRNNAPGQIMSKGDRDMVTEVDVTIEREVRAFLSEATPDIGFLGEEEGQASGHIEGRPFWVLDPVDGTANFAHGIPLCAVSLALVDGETSVIGVIDVPLLGERYEATAGGGVTLNDSPVAHRTTSRLSGAIVALGDYAVGEDAVSRNRARLTLTTLLAERVQRVRMLGSAAIDLAWVAAGRLDASVMLANKPWDTAAGVLMAREAGVVVCDLDGSPHTLESRGTVSVVDGLQRDLLALVQQATS